MHNKKTLKEHKEYLNETVKLSLWVAAEWKNREPNKDFTWILHERTPLVCHTEFNPKTIYDFPNFEGEKWPKLRLELEEIYNLDNDPKKFEISGFELLKPYIETRAKRDLVGINNDKYRPASWIRYDLSSKEEFLEIHMENSLYPKSFLSDEKYFYNKLNIAVSEAEKAGFKGLRTVSWLNDLPAWQQKMPKEWNNSIHDRMWDIEWHLGFWGQFLTANQCFNHKAAAKFRETGKLTFPMSKAYATISDFKKILNSK
ncbi:MAG: hypothetical protein OCD02_05475 [Spirochaetaceae bacterium]